MEIDKLRDEYDKLKSAIVIASPFIGSLLRRVRIILTSGVETAGVTPMGIMAINPKFWERLTFAGKAWILGHEVLHIAMRDLKRKGDRDMKLWNIVADAVNNDIEKEFLVKPYELKGVMIDDLYYYLSGQLRERNIDFSDFQRMSKEEIYDLIPKLGGAGLVLSIVSTIECDEDLETSELEGEVLQEGFPEMYQGTEEEKDQKWKDALVDAYTTQKLAGKVPAGLKRAIDRFLRPVVDWRILLRQSLRYGLGRTVVSTWRRPSRKHPSFPGIRRFTIPRIWCLIDQSGSIGREEATQFLSEVYAIAKLSPISVICWDADAYEIIKAKNQSEVVTNVVSRLRGGGGTVIRPCLKKTLEHMRPRDIVVVFTDGYIYDIDDNTTRALFSEVASKSSVSIFLTSDMEHKIEGWQTIRIRPK